MINLRFIFIYFALLSFGLNANSLAVEVSPQEKSPKLDRVIKIAQTDRPNVEENNLDISDSQSSNNTSDKPSRWMSLLGIAVSSVLYFFILFLLFKPEPESKDTPESQQLVEGDNNFQNVKPIDEERNLGGVRQLTGESTLPMIGMSSDEEFTYKPIANLEPSESKKSIDFDSEMTISEVSRKLEAEANPIVDSDISGKLTIVTSQNTEIDIISELIQDLQPSDRLETSNEHRDLRRKAIWELGQTSDFRAVEPLVQIMPQVDTLEKNLILDAIVQITNRNLETINQVLLTSLEDDSADIRKNAIEDLTLLYRSASAITTRLSEMTADTDPEVQQTAQWALGQFDRLSIPVASVEYNDSEDLNLNIASSNGNLN